MLSSELEPIQEFNVIVKPKRTSFAWAANINESTVMDIKKMISAKWPDIDDVDEATVVFLVGKNSFFITDDSVLQTTLKAMTVAAAKTFSVFLEMCMYT